MSRRGGAPGRRKLPAAFVATVVAALCWCTATLVAMPAGLLPGPERPFSTRIETGHAGVPYISGDAGVVLLDAGVACQVADPAAYRMAREQVAPALRGLFRSAAVRLAADRTLDDILAAPAALGGDIVAAMNRDLLALARAGGNLGVEVTGVDLSARVPPGAEAAFAASRGAAPAAEQALADAHGAAARLRQQAVRDADARLMAARAAASEQIAAARVAVATILALEQRNDPASRPGLLDRAYRDGIARVLTHAGAVTAVDAKAVSRVIIPGAAP